MHLAAITCKYVNPNNYFIMIEFKNIKKSFGEKVVLDGVSHVMETGKGKPDYRDKWQWQNCFAKMPGGII